MPLKNGSFWNNNNHYIIDDRFGVGLNNVESKSAIVKDDTRIPPVVVDVVIDDVSILIEIDSGACISVMPAEICQRFWPHVKINECLRVLVTYDNGNILPLGEIIVNARYKNKVVLSKIYGCEK